MTFSLIVSLIVLLTSEASAQAKSNNAPFSKGVHIIQAGLGLGSTFTSGLNTKIPPVNFVYERGISNKISLGGYFGYSSADENLLDIDIDYKYRIMGLRGSYHFSFLKKLDTYAGLMLGYIEVSADYKTDNPFLQDFSPSASGFGGAVHFGARYPFSENLGAYAEVGYGVSLLNIGLSLKL